MEEDAPLHPVSRCLAEFEDDRQAGERLLPLVYDELRRIAQRRMAREDAPRTLSATGLVHEAWAAISGPSDPGWDGRTHFLGAAAKAMRNILVDQARRRRAAKRGGDQPPEPEIEVEAPSGFDATDILSIDEALTRLEASHPRAASVVMLRFFTGLTAEETAGRLDCSLSTVEADWRFARAWLQRELKSGATED